MKKLTALIFLCIATSAYATQTITAHVNGMVCAFCAQGIEKKARALPQTQDVYVNLKQKIVAVELKDNEQLSPDTLSALVKDAGYDVTHTEIVDEKVATMRTRMEAK